MSRRRLAGAVQVATTALTAGFLALVLLVPQAAPSSCAAYGPEQLDGCGLFGEGS